MMTMALNNKIIHSSSNKKSNNLTKSTTCACTRKSTIKTMVWIPVHRLHLVIVISIIIVSMIVVPTCFSFQISHNHKRHYFDGHGVNRISPTNSLSTLSIKKRKHKNDLFQLTTAISRTRTGSLYLSNDNAINSFNDTSTSSTVTQSPPPKSSSPTVMEQALKEAKELQKRAEQERLEAEKMRIELTLTKIQMLEQELKKLVELETSIKPVIVQLEEEDDENNNNDKEGEQQIQANLNLIKRSEELKKQIDILKSQLNRNENDNTSTTTPTPTKSIDIQQSSTSNNNISSSSSSITIPEEEMKKLTHRFSNFPRDIKELYCRAINTSVNDNDIESIVRKLYILDQQEKQEKRYRLLSNTNNNNNTSVTTIEEPTLLEIAHTQVGFTILLPQNIQQMFREVTNLQTEKNVTFIVETLLKENKVQMTDDFGGVEFTFNDYEKDRRGTALAKQASRNDGGGGGESGGLDRGFTKEEIKSAVELFDNLPLPMKTMLASGIGLDGSNNSTQVIELMIEKKKIKPSKDGVEFLVYDDSVNDAEALKTLIDDSENYNYVKSMLPDVTRKAGQSLSQEVANAFLAEVLGKKTFNPTSKPEAIPGGYIIRGENKMKTYDELVIALERGLEKSSIAGKVQPFVIRDPTFVTEEQFETNSYELPVVMITGTNLAPATNRFVKPLVTVLGAVCVASFSLAVCLNNEEAIKDPVWVEAIVSPLVLSILGTQILHEVAHQIVAFKDKFKTGAPTIVPSFQIGLTGCITPLKTPPPNVNSLFDFAISGPLVGMIASLGLMYYGLEQQVFMDALTQSQLPSLPVSLLKSSSLAGGMVEWLLGDGLLLSPDPSAVIRLHPFAIAGYVGLISNALNLLPIGNTDGGRISLSLFGRSVSRVVRSITIGFIVFSSFFGGDSVNILLLYTIYAQIWQRESEIPCKNEVDSLNDVRAIIAFATGILVALSVIPMT